MLRASLAPAAPVSERRSQTTVYEEEKRGKNVGLDWMGAAMDAGTYVDMSLAYVGYSTSPALEYGSEEKNGMFAGLTGVV